MNKSECSMPKAFCDRASARSGHFITDWKCQIRHEALNDRGRGIWRGQMTGHMLSPLGGQSAMKSEGELRWRWAISTVTLTGE